MIILLPQLFFEIAVPNTFFLTIIDGYKFIY